jgi:hypothetical protein
MPFATNAGAGYSGIPSPVKLHGAIDIGGAYVSPPTGRVFFVRGDGTAVLNYDDQYSALASDSRHLYPSVPAALAECAAYRGDTIYVLPKSTGNIATADAWSFVEGVRIIGLGQGDTRPTFTFSAAAGTLVFDSIATSIQNCRFLISGPKTGGSGTEIALALPLLVSAEGLSLVGNELVVGYDAYNTVTTLMGVRANNCVLAYNHIRGYAVASPVTAGIVLAGDTDKSADGFVAYENTISMAMAAATTGVISNATSTGTANRIHIENNRLHNSKADSSHCISFEGDSVTTGWVIENRFRVEDNASVQAVSYGGTGLDITLDNNKIVNVKNETGVQNQGTLSA